MVVYIVELLFMIFVVYYYIDFCVIFIWGGSDLVYGLEGEKVVEVVVVVGMVVIYFLGLGVGYCVDVVNFGFLLGLVGLVLWWFFEEVFDS